MTHADINKFIADKGVFEHDPEGHLLDLPPWSEAEAERLAGEEGLTLTIDHWEVIRFLRDRYRRSGQAHSGRIVAEELDLAFRDRGGSRFLYSLFPQGPVAQGSRIAGLPLPPYATDRSFGSIE